MQILFYILIIILALVLWSITNERSQMRKLEYRLKEEWTKIPEEEYTTEKFESLQSFYRSRMDDQLDIDDITWNDLDMDEIYMIMNNTQSAIGEEYLYALLRKPCFSKEELEERNRLIQFFQKDETKRIALQVKLNQIGKLRQISVFEYLNRLAEEEAKSNLPHYLMALGLILSLGLIFIEPGIGGVCTLFFIGNNIFRYYAIKATIEKNLTVFSYMLRLLKNASDIIKSETPEISAYIGQLKKDVTIFKHFKKGAAVLVSQNAGGNLTEMFLDYLRMLFHIDLIKYNSMLSFFKKNREVLNRIFTNIGFLDSMTAAASFRDKLDYYSLPELTKSTHPRLHIKELYHPLIAEPVTNSITEERSVLITGSNASGKSTFIKTLAINTILSQTIFTSTSREYSASYFTIYSSMALRDNLFGNESYYIVEIKSLKRILDRLNKEVPTLVLIDEVLRGTNTLERIAASSRILVSIARRNSLCFAATHDIELTHILEKYYSNYHFQERIAEKQILFDYKLYQGRAVSKNAIKLLGLLGYTPDIIEEAENAAEEFLTNGEWEAIR